LLALVLGFGINTIAHVTHGHDATTLSSHHLSCGYCLYFGNLADTPRHLYAAAPATTHIYVVAQSQDNVRSRTPDLAAQPRAPPLS
jgi:hypothetical protein